MTLRFKMTCAGKAFEERGNISSDFASRWEPAEKSCSGLQARSASQFEAYGRMQNPPVYA
jgi:hypothetical protein